LQVATTPAVSMAWAKEADALAQPFEITRLSHKFQVIPNSILRSARAIFPEFSPYWPPVPSYSLLQIIHTYVLAFQVTQIIASSLRIIGSKQVPKREGMQGPGSHPHQPIQAFYPGGYPPPAGWPGYPVPPSAFAAAPQYPPPGGHPQHGGYPPTQGGYPPAGYPQQPGYPQAGYAVHGSSKKATKQGMLYMLCFFWIINIGTRLDNIGKTIILQYM
jgi:hypothetical protein